MENTSLNLPYIILSGVIILAAFAVLAVFRPAINTILTTQHGIQERKIVLQEKQQFLRTLDQKIAVLQAQAQHEQRLNVVLPVDDAVEDMLRVVHLAAQTSGGVIQSVNNLTGNIQNETNARRARGETVDIPTGVAPLAVQIEFTGTYQELRHFVEQLERSPRLIDITSLEVTRNPRQLDQVGAKIILRFYKQVPNPSAV